MERSIGRRYPQRQDSDQKQGSIHHVHCLLVGALSDLDPVYLRYAAPEDVNHRLNATALPLCPSAARVPREASRVLHPVHLRTGSPPRCLLPTQMPHRQVRLERPLELSHHACQRAHARKRPARRPLPVARVALSQLRHVDDAVQLGGRKQRHNQSDGYDGEHSAAFVAERSCTCPVCPPVLGPALTSQAWAGISASAMPGHRYARSLSPCRRSAYLRPRSAAYEVRAAATPWISRLTK